MRLSTAPRRALLALAGVALLAGCDTNNGGGILRDLAGTYTFVELRFVPQASAIQPADVLPRLNTDATRVDVASNGRTFFFMEEGDGTRLIAEANATATSTTATFRALAADDVSTFVRYLLPSVLSLSHDGGVTVMSGSPSIRANLHQFDDQAYQGLTDVPGTLFVRLERR